jgi:hypothetical protein
MGPLLFWDLGLGAIPPGTWVLLHSFLLFVLTQVVLTQVVLTQVVLTQACALGNGFRPSGLGLSRVLRLLLGSMASISYPLVSKGIGTFSLKSRWSDTLTRP